ncbi:MAG: NADPH:quinone oxidoreductase family protein [Rhizobiaceae bacterium]|nr:NADPH:quinone oxidoreductase family protein [Rhizobiaceae bacterium]
MKAVLCHNFGPLSDLRLSEADNPHPSAGQIVVRVEACGVNFYDGLAVQGKYQTKPAFPFAPGGEISGVVVEAGPGVTGLNQGDRVLAFTGFGGYAEFAAVDSSSAFPLPDTIDFDVAAALMIGHATAHHALKDRAQLRPGETVLVLGAAGGVGLAAVEIATLVGATVIAAASSPEKLELAESRGASGLINYSSEDLRTRVKELTGGRGADIVIDPVGGDFAATALRCLAIGGRYLVIGFAAGDIPTFAFNQLLLKQTSVVGVLWGAFAKANPGQNAANIAELMDWLAAGEIRPHVAETWPLDQFTDALGRVMRREAKGKVVIRPQERSSAIPQALRASA